MTRRPSSEAEADRIGGLYDRFAGVLYRYALMILADPAGAADAVQQVFVALLGRTGGAIDEEERYLRRSVRNACYSALRQRRPNVLSASDAPLLEPYVKGLVASAERIRCARRLLAGEMVNCQP